MKKPDYYTEKYIIRYRTLSNERLYLSKDGEIIEEPQLDRVATYFDAFEINYGDIIKFGEKYNEEYRSDPIISYEIAKMKIEVYMYGTPNRALICIPSNKEGK